MSAQLDALLSRLDKVRNHGHGKFFATCPAHAEKTGSLYVTLKDDGKITLHCFGGCRNDDVLGAIGMAFKDLFPAREVFRDRQHGAKVEPPVAARAKPPRRYYDFDQAGYGQPGALIWTTAVYWDRQTEYQAIRHAAEKRRLYDRYGPTLKPQPNLKDKPLAWAVAARDARP